MPGTWALYDVMSVDEQLRPAPIEGASVASERRDRVASTPAAGGRGRRWIVPAAACRDRAHRWSPPTSSRVRTRRSFRQRARSPRSRQTARSPSRSRSRRCQRRSPGGRAGSGSPTSSVRSTGWTRRAVRRDPVAPRAPPPESRSATRPSGSRTVSASATVPKGVSAGSIWSTRASRLRSRPRSAQKRSHGAPSGCG